MAFTGNSIIGDVVLKVSSGGGVIFRGRLNSKVDVVEATGSLHCDDLPFIADGGEVAGCLIDRNSDCFAIEEVEISVQVPDEIKSATTD